MRHELEIETRKEKVGSLNLYVSPDAESAAEKVAKYIDQYVVNARTQSKNILFLTSGGSAFNILNYISEDIYGPDITIGMLDERFDPTNETNQFSQLAKTTFYKRAQKAGSHFINTRTLPEESFEDFTIKFEQGLTTWSKENPSGVTITTIGMGPDGHISGIMPFPENPDFFDTLFMGEQWVVGYDATGKNPYPLRTTTTPTFLKTITHTIIYIVGAEKSEAFCNMLQAGPIAETPARLLPSLAGNMYIDTALFKNIQGCLNQY